MIQKYDYLLRSLSNFAGNDDQDLRYILDALAGTVMCGDLPELRQVVQEFVRRKIEMDK